MFLSTLFDGAAKVTPTDLFTFSDDYKFEPAKSQVFTLEPADPPELPDQSTRLTSASARLAFDPPSIADFAIEGRDPEPYGEPHNGRTFWRGWQHYKGTATPVTVIETNSLKDGTFSFAVLFRAHIRPVSLRKDHSDTPNASRVLQFDLLTASGTTRHELDTGRIGTRGDKQLGNLFAQLRLEGSSPAVMQRVEAFFALIEEAAPPAVVTQRFAGWTDVSRPELRWLSWNAVETATAVLTHDATCLYPPRDLRLSRTTTPDDATMQRIGRDRQLGTLRDVVFKLNPQIPHVIAGLIGYSVFTLAPYRPSAQEPNGHTRFYLEVFGPTGVGKTPLVSLMQLFQGAGYLAKEGKGQVGLIDSTARGDDIVASSYPNHVLIGPDFKQMDHAKAPAAHARIINRAFDGAETTKSTRDGRAKTYASPTGGVIGTAEIDMQRQLASDQGHSTALRMIALQWPEGARSSHEVGELRLTRDGDARRALAIVGYEFRRWIMRGHTGIENALYRECGDRADEICAPVRTLDGKAGDNLSALVTGLLFFGRFLADHYRKAGKGLADWMTGDAVASLVEHVRARTEMIVSGTETDRQQHAREVIGHALAQMARDDGYFEVNPEQLKDRTALFGTMVSHGQPATNPFAVFGYERNTRVNGYKHLGEFLPKNPGHKLGFVKFDGSNVTLNIPTASITEGSPIVTAIRSHLKRSEQQPMTVSDMQKALAVLTENKGYKGNPMVRHIGADGEGTRVRCYVLPLDVVIADLSDPDAEPGPTAEIVSIGQAVPKREPEEVGSNSGGPEITAPNPSNPFAGTASVISVGVGGDSSDDAAKGTMQ